MGTPRPGPRPPKLADWPAPRVHADPQPVVAAAMNRARSLVCMVRDEGPESIGAVLDRCTGDDLYALVTVLACLVPDDRSIQSLLAWMDEAPAVVSRGTTAPRLRVAR